MLSKQGQDNETPFHQLNTCRHILCIEKNIFIKNVGLQPKNSQQINERNIPFSAKQRKASLNEELKKEF